MSYRVYGRIAGACLALACCPFVASSTQAQETADTTVAVRSFAENHLQLDLDGIQPPWLGRSITDQRINWTLDSLNVLRNGLQNEWRPAFSGASNGVFLYQLQAGDTAGIPIAYDYDTYRLIKTEQNTMAAWQASVQSQLSLRDAEKARDLVSISLPFRLPKAMESIVGEGGAGLKVNGFKRINFSGLSQWRDGPNVSLAQSQSKFPSLDMEQITQMTITGKIGSKIEVKVDQDSRRVTDLGNRIQIRYRGFEDEIIQTIEAGNTNLALPNTQFVGYSQRVQGLFGVKATAKIGHVNLTAIASQEKGTTEGATFAAGAQGEQTFLRDDQYMRYRYFWIFDPFTDTLWTRYFVEGDSIVDFRLYKTAKFETAQTEPLALCLPAVPPGLTIDAIRLKPDSVYSSFEKRQNMELIEDVDYFLERRQFWLTLADTKPLAENELLACYMTIQTPTGLVRVGDFKEGAEARTDSVSLLLHMLKTDQPRPTEPTWLREWKNVYDLGARDINIEGLKVDVYRGRRGTERQEGQNLNNVDGTAYIELLGLDQRATNGAPQPDGIIDDDPGILDRRRGHLIFPNRFPFAPTTYPDTVATDTVNVLGDVATYAQNGVRLPAEAGGIYAGALAVNRQEASQYYLTITTTERRTNYSLGRVNIIEGSETVKLNGTPLTRGVDYNISYEIGQINFITDAVLDPNANVTVDYEYEPFFSVDRKTLFGVRGEYAPSPDFNWGATMLYKSEKQPDNQKPRLGEEPSRTLIWDTDLGIRRNAPFLTKLTDALPLVEARAPSAIDIQGELAQSLPNPNTAGEVFIDDFEGSQEIASLPLFREAWTPASPPGSRDTLDRTDLYWYNRYEPYRITEIYNKDEVPAEDRTQVLTLLAPDPGGPQVWAGVQRSVSAGLQNLSNTQYMEFRIQGNRGLLVFDMGEISEDINKNGIWDTEDRVRGGFRNGILDEDEDVGLDGIPDSLETNAQGPFNPVTNPDPHGDNWFYSDETRNDYSRINGMEGNRPDPLRGWLPDTEDINGNNNVDLLNNYFEFTINLADPNDPYLVKNSDYCDGCSDGATLGPWRTFRIPIGDSLLPGLIKVGYPELEQIKYMRLFLTGLDSGQATQVNVADMNLVSYRWRDTRIESEIDSSQDLRVAVVNTRENANYTSPPGVEEVVDRVTLIGQGEQSLLLNFADLQPRIPDGDTLFVIDSTTDTSGTVIVDTTIEVRDRIDRAIVSQTLLSSLDFTGYRKLDMYVHGDDSADGQVVFFLRFGNDTLNFYEYRVLVSPGWNANNYVAVNFDDLTGIKFAAQENRTASEWPDIDTTANPYRIRGNPSLTRVEYLEMGVANLDGRLRSGEIWVDELRLTDVRDDVGYAARLSVNMSLSDFAGVGVSYRNQNYAFKTLTQTRQNVVNSSSAEDININARVSPDKLLPPSIPLQLPVSFTWGRNTSTPYFLTRSDIVVPADARADEASTTERKGVTVAARYAKAQGNFAERYFLAPLSASLSYSQSENRSPTVRVAESKSYNGQGRYALQLQTPPGVPFLYWTRFLFMPRAVYSTRLTLLPSQFNASGTYNERRSATQYVVDGPITGSYARDFTGDFNLAYQPITNLTFDYNHNTQRDLRDPGTVSLSPRDFRLGVETNFRQSYRSSYTNRWIPFLEQRYSYDVSYQENVERQTDNTRTLTSSRNFQATFGLTWVRLFGKPNPNDRWFTIKVYQPVRKLVRGVFNRLDNLAVSYGSAQQIRGFGYEERPDWTFVWGINENPGAPKRNVTSITSRDSKGTTKSYSARTGINLLGARFTLSYTLRDQISDNSSTVTKTQSETFPSIRVTFSDLTKIGLVSRLMNSATLESAYDVKSDFTRNEQTRDVTSESDDVRFNPLLGLNLNWRGNVSTTFKIDYTERTQRQPSSATESETKSTEDGFQFNLRYSFSAPGGIKLPLLGGLKLKSTMNVSFGAAWTKSRAEQRISRGSFELRSERTTFSVPVQVGYSFSQTLSGGLRARWQDTFDKVQQANSHVRELGFWVEFRF